MHESRWKMFLLVNINLLTFLLSAFNLLQIPIRLEFFQSVKGQFNFIAILFLIGHLICYRRQVYSAIIIGSIISLDQRIFNWWTSNLLFQFWGHYFNHETCWITLVRLEIDLTLIEASTNETKVTLLLWHQSWIVFLAMEILGLFLQNNALLWPFHP